MTRHNELTQADHDDDREYPALRMPVDDVVLRVFTPERPQDCYCRVCRAQMRGFPGEPCPWCKLRSERRI